MIGNYDIVVKTRSANKGRPNENYNTKDQKNHKQLNNSESLRYRGTHSFS